MLTNITAVLRVTADLHGETIPVLHVRLDPACLSWTIALDVPARPRIKHRDGCRCGQVPVLNAAPDYVQTLSSGVEPTDNPVTLHPLIAEDLDSQTCEMERARAQAAVSCHDYLLDGEQ